MTIWEEPQINFMGKLFEPSWILLGTLSKAILYLDYLRPAKPHAPQYRVPTSCLLLLSLDAHVHFVVLTLQLQTRRFLHVTVMLTWTHSLILSNYVIWMAILSLTSFVRRCRMSCKTTPLAINKSSEVLSEGVAKIDPVVDKFHHI